MDPHINLLDSGFSMNMLNHVIQIQGKDTPDFPLNVFGHDFRFESALTFFTIPPIVRHNLHLHRSKKNYNHQ